LPALKAKDAFTNPVEDSRVKSEMRRKKEIDGICAFHQLGRRTIMGVSLVKAIDPKT
jgi:hypothetical protein